MRFSLPISCSSDIFDSSPQLFSVFAWYDFFFNIFWLLEACTDFGLFSGLYSEKLEPRENWK